jgi:hypothetical protein
LLMILLGLFVAFAVYPAMSQQPPDSPLSILPVPGLSPLDSPLPTNTPTFTPEPPPAFVAWTATPQPTWAPQPTWTPQPAPVVINLAEGLAKDSIFTFFVERADGRQEIYFVPVADVPLTGNDLHDADLTAYQAYKQRLLQLGPDDRVVYECASTRMSMVPEQFQCLGRKQVTLNVPR